MTLGGFMELVKRESFGISEFLLNFTSKDTRKAYKKDLEGFFSFCANHDLVFANPSEVKLIHLVAYRDYMKLQYAPKTVARKLATVRSLMNFFVSRGFIDSNPAITLKIDKAVVSKPTEAFSDEEAKMMINAPDRESFFGNNYSMVFYLFFRLALRRSELVNLRLSDIYCVGDSLVLGVKGKGGKVRELPLPQDFNEFFRKFKHTYFKISGRILEQEDYLIQSKLTEKNIKPMDTSSVYKTLRRYAKKLGIDKRVSPHSCRATAITNALEQGAPITAVADLAGHADISTTQIYWKRRQGFKDSPVHQINYGDKDENYTS